MASLQLQTLPTLWNGAPNYIFLKMGTFYNSMYGYINYALGVQVQVHIHTGSNAPSFIAYNFALTAWQYDTLNTPTVIGNDFYTVKVYNVNQLPIAASLTLPVVMGESSTFVDSGSLGLAFGASGSFVGSTTVSYAPGDTVLTIVPTMVTALNAASGSSGFTAAASVDGLSIILTAVTPGAAGNTLQVMDASISTTTGVPPAFYFPITNYSGSFTGFVSLEGGSNGGIQGLPLLTPDPQISTVDVGGTIYFANLGPIIMKYSGPGTLTISSMYAGVKVISKFAGSLIGLGDLPQLLNVVNNSDMVFSWSAANNLDEWSPVTASGNVTGAGFAELADIGDPLKGLIVTNNTAFILRSQGISYSTSLGSGQDPFSFQHVGLADEGEGAQNTALICQYDQTGAFVGNTNVYQISGQITSIGEKIASDLFANLELSTGPLSATSCSIMIGNRIEPIVVFLIGAQLYIYLPQNKTWMQMSFATGLSSNATVLLTSLSSYNTTADVQRKALLSLVTSPSTTGTTSLYALQEGIGFTNQISPNPRVYFPQEELLFGRDVVIDSLYISLNYSVTTQVLVTFFFNGVEFSAITLTAGNTLSQIPVEMQIFPISGAFTAHSPQLEITVGPVGVTYLRFSKIQIYGSWEPNQRPV